METNRKMSRNPIVKSFRELGVYKQNRAASLRLYDRTKVFPKAEQFALTDQVRRASRAVGAMIAEAWGRRRYRNVFVNKIDEALGESNEVRAWLDSAVDCGMLKPAEYEEFDSAYESIGAKLSRMIDAADSFCKNAADTDYRQH